MTKTELAKTELAKTELARPYARIADRRKDWREKRTTKLVASYGLITFEKLNTMNMAKRSEPKEDPDWPVQLLFCRRIDDGIKVCKLLFQLENLEVTGVKRGEG